MNTQKNLIISGGAGFIASNFLNKFVPLHPEIHFINVDCLTYAGKLTNLTQEVWHSKNHEFYNVDIANDKDLRDTVVREHRIDGIINFAAESHVDYSIEHPDLFARTNIMGTLNLLQIAKEQKVDRFLQISTDEVMGSLGFADEPWKEDSLLKPNSPYAASKAAAEMLVHAYHRTYNLDTVITRSSNNYGPNQDKSKLIPKFIDLISSGKKAPLMGDGAHVRDWLYVEDNIDGIWAAYNHGTAGEVYNLGGGQELPNMTVAQHIADLAGINWKNEELYIEHIPDRLGHDRRYAIDCTRAKHVLGWEPKVRFEEGIKKTWDFYRGK